MRLIGTLDNKTRAERFAAYLTVKDVATHVEHEGDNWEIWIKDEDQVAEASEELKKFTAQPDAPEYTRAVEEANSIIREQRRQREAARQNRVQIQNRWQRNQTGRPTPLTTTIILIAVVVTLFTNFGQNPTSAIYRALADVSLTQTQAEQMVHPHDPSADSPQLRTAGLRRLELWRLVTPIFLHMSILHLGFNCLWMFYFGRQIEGRYGTPWLAILVVATAIPSNLASLIVPLDWQGTPVQEIGNYWITLSGGLSGVLFGLFGYIWMKMLFDPDSGLYLTPITIMVLVIWFLIGLMAGDQILGEGSRINNWAHGVGLVVGLAIGYFPKLLSDLGWGQRPTKKK